MNLTRGLPGFVHGNLRKAYRLADGKSGCLLGGISSLGRFSLLTRSSAVILGIEELPARSKRYQTGIVITFAGYGSPVYINDPLTPTHISPCQNTSLVAHDYGDQIAVGDLTAKLFVVTVFDITRGMLAFLRLVGAHDVTWYRPMT